MRASAVKHTDCKCKKLDFGGKLAIGRFTFPHMLAFPQAHVSSTLHFKNTDAGRPHRNTVSLAAWHDCRLMSKKERESRHLAPYSQNAFLSQLGKRMLLAHNMIYGDGNPSAIAAHCSQFVFVDSVQTEIKPLLSKKDVRLASYPCLTGRWPARQSRLPAR